MAQRLDLSEINSIRDEIDDAFLNQNNLEVISGKRWGEIIAILNRYRVRLKNTPPDCSKKAAELYSIFPMLDKKVDDFSDEIKKLRGKNTDIVSDISTKIFESGEANRKAISLATNKFYRDTSTNYAVIFMTDREIGEFLYSMKNWDVSGLLAEIEYDLKNLIEKAKVHLEQDPHSTFL